MAGTRATVADLSAQRTKIKTRSLGAILGGSLGNIVEWFDWTVCATLAAVFLKQFFPSADPTVSVLAAFAGFAGGYLMRPVGALILSPLADRYGRHKVTALTIGFEILLATGVAAIITYGGVLCDRAGRRHRTAGDRRS